MPDPLCQRRKHLQYPAWQTPTRCQARLSIPRRRGGSPVTTPARTTDQRMTALAKGNRIRTTRAKLKRDLKHDGSLNEGIRILRDPPEVLHTMKIETLLMSLPGFARSKANEMLRKTATSPSKTLAGLSERQRGALVAQLLDVQVRRLAL